MQCLDNSKNRDLINKKNAQASWAFLESVSLICDLGRIQTCNLLSRNQMRYSVAPRGLLWVQIYFFFIFTAKMNLEKYIRSIPNFPVQGILFRDITPLLLQPKAVSYCLESLLAHLKDQKIDKVAAIEARGFIFGSLLAQHLQVGFIPIRKAGKLPGETYTENYGLEYGDDVLQLHTDAILPGEKIVLHDDLLATGGTALAACNLIEKAGGLVTQCSFIIELAELEGRKKIGNYRSHSLLQF